MSASQQRAGGPDEKRFDDALARIDDKTLEGDDELAAALAHAEVRPELSPQRKRARRSPWPWVLIAIMAAGIGTLVWWVLSRDQRTVDRPGDEPTAATGSTATPPAPSSADTAPEPHASDQPSAEPAPAPTTAPKSSPAPTQPKPAPDDDGRVIPGENGTF